MISLNSASSNRLPSLMLVAVLLSLRSGISFDTNVNFVVLCASTTRRRVKGRLPLSRMRTPPTHTVIRVALAESTRMFGQILAALLRRDKGLEVTDVTANPVLLTSVNAQHDVVLISAVLENDPQKGFEWVEALRLSSPNTRAVMLLDCPRRDLVVEAFRVGARGVFCRCDPLKMLPKCVRSVHGGQIWANAEQIEFVFKAFAEAPVTRLVSAEGEALLSTREQEVVRFVAEGLGNREIAAQLHLSEHTVKNYIFHIFNKLGISNRVELVLYAANQRVSSKLRNGGLQENQTNQEELCSPKDVSQPQ
jgi:two-component system nitrate/nitrite response regulator NarL